MHNPQSIVMLLLESILTGFGIVIPILALIRTSNLKTLAVKDLFVLTTVQMVRIAGIAYFAYWAISVFAGLREDIPMSRLFGTYWWVYWYKPVTVLVFTQLFWFKKIYYKNGLRIVFALLLLILPSLGHNYDRFTTQHPLTGWIGYFLFETLLNIIVFIFITFAVMLSSGKLRK